MFCSAKSGIDEKNLQRYLDEQVYSLPGIDDHRDVFTVLLTGSRAIGYYREESDVDIDVICPGDIYRTVQAASLRAGIIHSRTGFFCSSRNTGNDIRPYFGANQGVPHFSLIPLEKVKEQFETFEDPAVWIWTSAMVVSDPNRQFQAIRDGFDGYPQEVLVRKIKYHWLMCWYSVIDVFPSHHHGDYELSTAGAALLNGIHELLRLFFLVENKPFPYTEKLPVLAEQTKLGKRFGLLLQNWAERVTGKIDIELPVWERLESVCKDMLDDQLHPETRLLEEACVAAIVGAGVEKEWMENYYSNIHELLTGQLGPVPL